MESCGRPVVNVEFVSIMGWYTHRNTGTIGYRPLIELHFRKYPIVVFSTFPNGWGVKTYRIPAANRGPLREPQRALRADRTPSQRRAGPQVALTDPSPSAAARHRAAGPRDH